jgi:small subunit ribosomal protein S15Ae
MQSPLVHSQRVRERMRIGCVAARCSGRSSASLLESLPPALVAFADRRISAGGVGRVIVGCALRAGYIGEFELIDDKRSGKIVVQLIGRINKAGVISPRFDLALSDMEKWTSYLLPSGQFGHLVLTTSYGIMDHQEAIRKHTGGKILGYFY